MAASDIDSEAALGIVEDYTKSAAKRTAGDHLARYAKTSATFASVGGTIGSVFPGVGTAIGGLVGAGAGLLYEGAGDAIAALFPDDPKSVQESPEKAEVAYHTYQALGGERGTKAPYESWWKVYVAAGRPSLEVLEAAKAAESAARKLARERDLPPPPPPPPPVTRSSSNARVASVTGAASVAFADQRPQGAATGFLLALPALGALLWLMRR